MIRASYLPFDSLRPPEPKNVYSYFLDIMYVDIIKKIFLAHSSELMGVRLISASWAKNAWFLLSRHDVRRVHEKFSSRRFERAICCLTHFGLLSPKTFDSYFTDTMYVEGMKNFFYPIRANGWVLHSFRLPEPKNVCFLLSRHDVRQVHEKFSSRRFERAIWCLTHFRLLSPKTFHCYFLDIMSVEFMKNIFSPIRASWWVLDSFRPPEPKNVWFQLCRHHVRRIHEKFFLADSSERMGVRLISVSWAQKRLIPTF